LVDAAEVVVVEAEEAVDVVVVAGVAEAAVDEDGVSRYGKEAMSRRKIKISACKPGQDDGRCTFEIRKSRVGDSVRFRNPRLIKCVRDHLGIDECMRKVQACTAFGKIGSCAQAEYIESRNAK
jgi:hypothetical protein